VPVPDSRPVAPGKLDLVRQFINTAEVETGEDELADPKAAQTWFRERGLIGARDRLEVGDLARVHALREALRRLLADRERGRVEADTIRSLNALPTGALMRVSFDAAGEPHLEPVASGLDRALAHLLAIIERAAVDGTWERLKVCADDGCLWAFYDHSKNRSRSWCSMEVCGNRHKAREYRRRHRPAAGAKPEPPA
jgi:predicted RNA-binding Zn ribbon-like protein